MKEGSRITKTILILSALVLLITLNAIPARAVSTTATLDIVAPANGSVVPTNFIVSFAVSNFAIVQPGQPGQAPGTPNEGHLHVFLDGTNIAHYYTLWASPNGIPFTNIPPGNHTVFIRLVDDFHNSYTPDVNVTLNYRVTNSPGTPSLVILSPKDGSTVSPTFTVSFAVFNFSLTDPVGQPNALNTGHIHIFLDGNYVNLWARPEGVPVTIQGSGSHTVKLELVNNNHSPLSTDVNKAITVSVNDNVAGAASNASNYALAATILSVISIIIGVLVISKVWKMKTPA